MLVWRAQQLERFGASLRLGFVPTMGALHRGHAELLIQAVQANDLVVLSIFINPAQFGPAEDLNLYPRTLEQDLQLAAACGVTAVFMPEVQEIYPAGFGTAVGAHPGLATVLEGAIRPGHFDGVCLVVTVLLNLVRPTRLYLGQKDYQQVVVLKRLVLDLGFDIEVEVVPTVRDPDGLALSSRNRYFSDAGRRLAQAMPEGMAAAALCFLQRPPKLLDLCRAFEAAVNNWAGKTGLGGTVVIDYIQCLRPWELERASEQFASSGAPSPVCLVAAMQVSRDGQGEAAVRILDNLFLCHEAPWGHVLNQLLEARNFLPPGGHQP
jgi:pantoate--beta-alanine ligase